MASFNLANVFFVCLLAFIKSTHFASAADTLPVALVTTSHFLKYTFDQGAKCLGVAYDGMEVMKFDPSKPKPESVLFTIRGNTAIVKFTKAIRIFRLDNNGFKPVFTGKQEVRSVDILYKRGCDSYNYFGDGRKLHSYNAIEGILFNKVRSHAGGNAVEQVIFETVDLMDMVYQVDYDERDPAMLVVTTHHLNGLTTTFYKKNLGNWEKGKISGSCMELRPERVQFIIQSHLPKGVKFEKNNKYFKYTFEDDALCVGVQYDGKKPLYLDPKNPSSPFPKSVYFSIRDNKLFANFKDSVDIYKLDSGKYRPVFSGMKKAVSLDIENRKCNDVYDYSVDDKVHTFKAKGDNAFVKVFRNGSALRSTQQIWMPSSCIDPATKVVFDKRGSIKVLTTYHVSGMTRTFKKKGRDHWRESEPEDSTDKTESDKVEFLMEVSPKSQGISPEDDDYDGNDCQLVKNPEETYLTQTTSSPLYAPLGSRSVFRSTLLR